MTGLGLLVMRSNDRSMAVRVAEVIEVGDRGAWQVVPTQLPAMRGVVVVRGRLVPLIHLGALVGHGAAPPSPAPLMVVAESRGQWVALEVDEVDSASAVDVLAEAQAGGLPGLSAGALRRDDKWIPVLNLEALARRWQEPATRA
jgi:purine-binding chemotaxis protein CheW